MASKVRSKAKPRAKARPAKKRPVKRVTKKAAPRKKSAKKAVAKRPTKKASSKKSAVKKRPVKKSAKKSATKKAARKKSPTKRPSRTIRTSTSTPLVRDAIATPTRVGEYKLAKPATAPIAAPVQEESERRRLPLFLFIAIAGVIALVVATLSNNDSTTSVSPEPTPVESPTAEASPSQSQSEEPVVARLAPPENVYADYTPIGGRVTWDAPQGDTQPIEYLVKASYRGKAFKTIATLGPTAKKLELIKIDTPSETVFKVVAVYPEGEAESDISSIKGQYEVNG